MIEDDSPELREADDIVADESESVINLNNVQKVYLSQEPAKLYDTGPPKATITLQSTGQADSAPSQVLLLKDLLRSSHVSTKPDLR